MARTRNLTSDVIDRTALAALNTIASQVQQGLLSNPEAASRLRRAARWVSELRGRQQQAAAFEVDDMVQHVTSKRRRFVLKVKPDGRLVLGGVRGWPVIPNADPRHWRRVERIELEVG